MMAIQRAGFGGNFSAILRPLSNCRSYAFLRRALLRATAYAPTTPTPSLRFASLGFWALREAAAGVGFGLPDIKRNSPRSQRSQPHAMQPAGSLVPTHCWMMIVTRLCPIVNIARQIFLHVHGKQRYQYQQKIVQSLPVKTRTWHGNAVLSL